MKGHLRLVHPTPPGPPKEPRRRLPRIETRLFTEEQQRALKASLRTARGLFGTWGCLAAAMRADVEVVTKAANAGRVSAAVAICLAKTLGVPLERLMTPGVRLVPFPKVCPVCGRGDP